MMRNNNLSLLCLLPVFCMFFASMCYIAYSYESDTYSTEPVENNHIDIFATAEIFEETETIETETIETAEITETVESIEATESIICNNAEPISFEDSVWLYLKETGYSDVCAAAIMGNISVECSFRPYIYGYHYGNTYYGMFQWNVEYFNVDGLEWKQQIDFMSNTLKSQFKTSTNPTTTEEWLAMTDVEQAALIFAKVYERCGEGSYSRRQSEAVKFYKLYTENTND